MKKSTLILTFILLFINAYSQENFLKELGKPSMYELQMTSYSKDTTAEAVVLYDAGEVYFANAETYFKMNFNRKLRIKILNQAGLKYADFEVPLYQENYRLEELIISKAVVYNLVDNKLEKSELDQKKVFEEKYGKNWVNKKFTMPNVKVGSVIEIEYEVVSPYPSVAPTWYFQNYIPVVYSEFKIRAIPFYHYIYIAKGIDKFDANTQEKSIAEKRFQYSIYKEVTTKLVKYNIPAFKKEDFVPSENNYRMNLNMQLSAVDWGNGKTEYMSSWQNIATDALKKDFFGKYINQAEKEGKKLFKTNFIGLSNEEKIKNLVIYVKNNFNWNGNNAKYANPKLSDVLTKKTGNAAELNLLLLGYLKSAGIDAQPVLLSTNNNGKIDRDYPFESFFNYVLVVVNDNGKQSFYDATTSMLPYNELPKRCINTQGLVVTKTAEWVDIINDTLSYTAKNFDINLNADLTKAEAKVDYKAHSYDAFSYRAKYYNEEQRLKDYLKEQNIDVLGKIEVSNYVDSLEKPFEFSFSTETQVANTGNKIFVAPFLNQAPQDNMFKEAKRTLPLDFLNRFGDIYTAKIEIPQGYEIETLPKNRKINNHLYSLNYSAEQNENFVEITASFEFKRSKYEAKEFPALKSFYNDIIKVFNEMVVFVKK